MAKKEIGEKEAQVHALGQKRYAEMQAKYKAQLATEAIMDKAVSSVKAARVVAGTLATVPVKPAKTKRKPVKPKRLGKGKRR